jgi:hypothetical protein
MIPFHIVAVGDYSADPALFKLFFNKLSNFIIYITFILRSIHSAWKSLIINASFIINFQQIKYNNF